MGLTAALGGLSVYAAAHDTLKYADDVASAQEIEAYSGQSAAELGIPANYRDDRNDIVTDGLLAGTAALLLVAESRELLSLSKDERRKSSEAE